MVEVDWTRAHKEGRVKLPDGHHLFVKASGPARQRPGEPAIVIEHGLGGSWEEWVAVQRLVSRTARVYSYERAGYYRSDQPTKPPTAGNIAVDLHQMLQIANIAPPYLLVGHSYGGVLIGQYLADYPDEVFGK
ncbi:hypothetical protein BAUCODRAFT_147913 [Baudoinia panamericana UAMH 10762]|uniref:AB hydrolase-1 domain-containing protein n=1 Tax=Baudoinia panamericana (strain UAMH 10762) TaxID=717646 RepID=M2MI07_BAUPA|nr:uncharacterized protein BAUCODRAFT_147913 [Baudoinia panamericana UAMH 10762]EMC96281.1 hypothetical protein BAUCODRAFT_147913 [Baudoinia panamericana UAMH 10762]